MFWLIFVPLEDNHPYAPSFGSPCHGSDRAECRFLGISTSRYLVDAQIMYVDTRSKKVKIQFIILPPRSGLSNAARKSNYRFNSELLIYSREKFAVKFHNKYCIFP